MASERFRPFRPRRHDAPVHLSSLMLSALSKNLSAAYAWTSTHFQTHRLSPWGLFITITIEVRVGMHTLCQCKLLLPHNNLLPCQLTMADSCLIPLRNCFEVVTFSQGAFAEKALRGVVAMSRLRQPVKNRVPRTGIPTT